MTKKNDFAEVAAALGAIVKRAGPRLKCADTSGGRWWYPPAVVHKGKPLYAAGVRINKNYVSFHFVPLYMYPDLGARMSPALKRHRQGKACFNFKEVDGCALHRAERAHQSGTRAVQDVQDKGLI